jgi:protein-S-isoprenylcysteine O-methyltransferase Ste14
MARSLTWETVRQSCAALPDITDGRSYGTPALFVRKKLLARLREDGASIAVRTDPVSREFLLRADPAMYFLTDHYREYPWVLVRLSRAKTQPLRALLEAGWRQLAGKRSIAAWEGLQSVPAKRRPRPPACCGRGCPGSSWGLRSPAAAPPAATRAGRSELGAAAARRPGPMKVWLALRSLLWAVLLPGMFAGYLPWRFFGIGEIRLDWTNPVHYLALLSCGVGAALLAYCIWEFARRGRGTLSPLDPPRELVIRGLYRYVRNPMYLSVALVLTGELLLAPSRDFLLFALAWFGSANLFVIAYEEPALRARFGAAYEQYRKQVPRWLPALGRRVP